MNPRPAHWMPLPPPPTTQPQAKGEFGEPWQAGNGIYKADGSPAKVSTCMHRAIACVNLLAGHDLTKVAVVDKSVIKALEDIVAWDRKYPTDVTWSHGSEGELVTIIKRVKDVLAKLNAGGEG